MKMTQHSSNQLPSRAPYWSHSCRRAALTAALSALMSTSGALSAPSSATARPAGVTGEREVMRGLYMEAVKVIEGLSARGPDELYLLGRAYVALGRKAEAARVWREAIRLDALAHPEPKDRWTFVFPPETPLLAKEKQRLKDDFESELRELMGALMDAPAPASATTPAPAEPAPAPAEPAPAPAEPAPAPAPAFADDEPDAAE